MGKVVEKERIIAKTAVGKPKIVHGAIQVEAEARKFTEKQNKKQRKATTEKQLGVLEALEARVAELEARINELKANTDGLHFVELGTNLICMRGDEPVFIADRADEDAIAELGVMTDPRTLASLDEAFQILEQWNADQNNRRGM